MGDEATRVAAAYERTIAASVARVEVLVAVDVPPSRSRRRGGLLRPAVERCGSARAEGVLELRRRRYMLDHGGYARLGADGREWAGQPGVAISARAGEDPGAPTPLWLIDVLARITTATVAGADVVRGTSCTHLHVTADLRRASPLPLEVWIDEQHVRRVRFSEGIRTDTLELWDVGASLGELDWTRLHAFTG
jgi:hypothetical protein